MRSSLLAVAIIAAPTIALAQDQPDVAAEEDGYNYGDADTYELGGSLGASFAERVTTVTLSPSFGYFIVDHLELSGTFTFAYTRIEDAVTGMAASTNNISLVAEPSYHLPSVNSSRCSVGSASVPATTVTSSTSRSSRASV